jgi:very-short-patch-repair endonuclease
VNAESRSKPYLPYNKNLKLRSRNLRNHSTLGEVLLWKQLRAKKLMGYQFNRQKPLGNFIADFYCKALDLVIEVDGSSHEGKEQYDKDRDSELQRLGLTILHFTDQEMRKNLRGVVAAIERWVEAHEIKNSEDSVSSPFE